MRTRLDASARVRFAWPLDRQLGLCSLALLPAVVATAAVIQAPPALADPGRQGASKPEAARHLVKAGEEVRAPRRSNRRRGHRQTPVAGSSRQRVAAVHAAPARPQTRRRGSAPVVETSVADRMPLERRTLAAIHPLAPGSVMPSPDRTFAGDRARAGDSAAPRCKGAHRNAFALALASFARDVRVTEPAMVEGTWPHCRGASNPQSSWRLASLGSSLEEPGPPEPDWSIRWRASASCLAAELRTVLERVADEFGPLTVNSTCRSRKHNARVGGASRSYHLTGNAVDFRVRGSHRQVLKYLKRQRLVGGVAHYGGGVFHIDTGPRRTWGPNSWSRSRG